VFDPARPAAPSYSATKAHSRIASARALPSVNATHIPRRFQASNSQLIQPRSRNLILSCSAIASAVALALPLSVFLPLASP
jgi:hypothetical protein